ncbi:hypothetical protein [Ornithinicoccus halotolerans]|uniref:hypothetical protein n=1 Tax=Ornithinicoccus halotolerans TaxID=1748220 RepID=UPI00129757F7|nr:hypothetical protein [Ornithinicoccus halotolerans]
MPSDPRSGPPARPGRRSRVRVRRLLTTLVLLGLAGGGGVAAAAWLTGWLDEPECSVTAAGRSYTFTPEQTANAATIALVSVERGMPPRAASVALATALQESKLRNITYGDADSLGLFQQRPSQGWGTEEQVLDPVHASHAFYDALEQVSGWEDGVITDVAQQVQRSAYPTAYAQHEWEGRVLASVLTGETPAGLGCDLPEVDPEAARTATDLLGKADAQFGGAADGTVADQQRLVLTTGSRTAAWAVASWAVAHAEAGDVSTVTVDGRRWERHGDPRTWPAGGDDLAEGVVVIEVGVPAS